MRLKKYEVEEKTFETSESGERIGTNLLKHYHEDIGTKNREMKALRKIERMKRKTEQKIAKEVEKKTGNMQGIVFILDKRTSGHFTFRKDVLK